MDSSIQTTRNIMTVVLSLLPVCNKLNKKVTSTLIDYGNGLTRFPHIFLNLQNESSPNLYLFKCKGWKDSVVYCFKDIFLCPFTLSLFIIVVLILITLTLYWEVFLQIVIFNDFLTLPNSYI